jgi:hypothetical protein
MTIFCANKHLMELVDGNIIASSYCCNECQGLNNEDDNVLFRCEQCNYSLCSSCAEKDNQNGDKESQVKEENIRLSESSKNVSVVVRLQVGDYVEANYRSEGKYYPGKIKAVRQDGTYEIDYDDGDKESQVKEENIRLLNKEKEVGNTLI